MLQQSLDMGVTRGQYEEGDQAASERRSRGSPRPIWADLCWESLLRALPALTLSSKGIAQSPRSDSSAGLRQCTSNSHQSRSPLLCHRSQGTCSGLGPCICPVRCSPYKPAGDHTLDRRARSFFRRRGPGHRSGRREARGLRSRASPSPIAKADCSCLRGSVGLADRNPTPRGATGCL